MIKNMLNSYNIITIGYNMATETAADAGRRWTTDRRRASFMLFWYIFYACFVIP